MMPVGTQSALFHAVWTCNQSANSYHASYYQQPQGMSAALLAELTKPFHRKLLDDARNTLASGPNEMVLVLSHAAAEQCTEWAITSLCAVRKVKELAEPIRELFASWDICNDKVRGVYSALSGDNPQQKPFWDRLKQLKIRRNRVVHGGEKCSAGDAADSVTVVEAYLLHVETVLATI